jgi:carotenoid cleavage dioxygenase
VAVKDGGVSFPAINKHDMATGACSQFDLGPGRHSGEPYFVPRRDASAEDDGYLMTFVFDAGRGASELVVLDAQDPGREPLARVMLPARVPFGFHGSWVPDGWDGPAV